MVAMASTTRGLGCSGDPQPQRVVIMGASNVALSIGTIVETLVNQFDQPLELLSAHGHGRSYGTETSVLGRRLPSILDCGLWKALDERDTCPAKVLITDIGNDLIYGQSVQNLMDWVRECLDRVERTQSEVVVTQLPVVNFDRITPRTFKLMKTLFFPSCDVELSEILSRAEKISEKLQSETEVRNVRFVEPQATWYGWDPIHVRRRFRSVAWPTILAFSHAQAVHATPRRLSFWQNARLKFLAPEYRVVFGFSQRKTQPTARLRDDSTVSFY